MKRILLIIIVVIGTIVYIGCQKHNAPSPIAKQDNHSAGSGLRDDVAHALRADIIARPANEQREMFRNLTPVQRCSVWLDKFENVFEATWNSEQIALLNEMQANLTSQVFTWGGTENQDFNNNFFPTWLAEARQKFTLNELYHIGAILDDIGSDQRQISGDSDCDCNYDDDWCIFSTCQGGTCDGAWGCGWWLNHACDGTCQ